MATEEVCFDAAAHSADAIQRAAYKFCGLFSVDLRHDGELFRCTLNFLDNTLPDPAVVTDFRIEVLDQVLRERIRDETGAVRNVILALAFSRADLDES